MKTLLFALLFIFLTGCPDSDRRRSIGNIFEPEPVEEELGGIGGSGPIEEKEEDIKTKEEEAEAEEKRKRETVVFDEISKFKGATSPCFTCTLKMFFIYGGTEGRIFVLPGNKYYDQIWTIIQWTRIRVQLNVYDELIGLEVLN